MPSESELILAAVIVLACSVLIYFIGRKVRMPLLIGYFITGILAGPYGLGLISEDEVSLMADLGIILLMFTIGLGISLKKLLSMKRIVLIGGGLQLLLTISAVWAVLSGFGIDPKTSLLIGFFIGCSSSAIILNIYQKTGEIDKLHGRVSFGIAIFQDICVIPMMMIVPLLSGDSSASVTSLIFNFIFGMIILVLILAASVVIVPKFLQRIALTRNSELFIIAVVLICFGIAWLISLNGVSLALGAFIAGMAISESDYSQEVKGIIMPMRDLLTSFFFVSIGMMLNLEFLYKYLLFVVILALAVMIVKSIINFISIKLIGGIAAGAALISAVGISQIGEFSFILGSSAMSYGIIDENIYQILLAAAILTMALTPFAVSASSYAVPKILRNSDKAFSGDDYEDKPDNDHVIIVGFGPSGRYVANALKSINIAYIVLETNSKTVTEEKKKGERIVFGDASREVILNFAGIKNASAVVITIPDMESTKAIISMARYINPKISIITRSRFISEISNLYRLGADEVVVDEKEAAIQITRRILSNKQVPLQDIEVYSAKIRNEIYNKYIEAPLSGRMKSDTGNYSFIDNVRLKAHEVNDKLSAEKSLVEQVRVESGCKVSGKKLSEIHLRDNYGVSVIAVRCAASNETITAPYGETVLNAGDTVVVIGTGSDIVRMMEMFISQDKKQ